MNNHLWLTVGLLVIAFITPIIIFMIIGNEEDQRTVLTIESLNQSLRECKMKKMEYHDSLIECKRDLKEYRKKSIEWKCEAREWQTLAEGHIAEKLKLKAR